MLYSHYVQRPQTFEASTFDRWSRDCHSIFECAARIGIALAGADGLGDPTATADAVICNGAEQCRHGVCTIAGRSCRGRCAQDSFTFERRQDPDSLWSSRVGQQYENLVRTAYKPYDVAVTACLLMLAHRFDGGVVLRSDGDVLRWSDGQRLASVACNVLPEVPTTIRIRESHLRLRRTRDES